jgi:hypothetical protein
MSGVYTNLAKKRSEQSKGPAPASPQDVPPTIRSSPPEVPNTPETKNIATKTDAISAEERYPETELREDDTVIPRHRDTTTPGHHDTRTPRHDDTTVSGNSEDILETIRKAVRQVGKEPATQRLTSDEKEHLRDIEYDYARQNIKTSTNEVIRIALNYVVADYLKHGKQSILARVLEKLNS